MTLSKRREGEKMQSLKEIIENTRKGGSGSALKAFYKSWVYFA